MNKQEEFNQSIENNDISKVSLLLKSKYVNPSYDNNWAIFCAASHIKSYDMVKLLLNDKRVDPSYLNNRAFRYTDKNENIDIATLLWNDQRVKNTLDNINFEVYDKIVKENIKNKINQF
jgi:hypothetical protein